MKGISHFVSGIAAASFIPAVVRAPFGHESAQGAWLLALAGVCGILADTLDFKLGRFLEQPDETIDPDPRPDAESIARQIAAAIDRTHQTGRSCTLRLHTIQLSPDRWQQYSILFDVPKHEVAVRIGPVVSTSQTPVGADLAGVQPEARAKTSAPMRPTYDAETKVDILSGPSFRFEREGEGVAIVFLPWHRAWSHSVVMSVLVGLICGLAWGRLAGEVAALAYAVHVFEDQLGAMGSNLFWPLGRGRLPGLNLLRSGDALPNFATVWTACALILFNLDRFADVPRLPALAYLGGIVGLPAILLVVAYALSRNREKPKPAEAVRQGELVDETQETEV